MSIEVIEVKEKEEEEYSNPDYLYKIVSVEQWEKSQSQNWVENSLMDKDFIHLAEENQIDHVAKKFWNNQDYIILQLDSQKLVGHLVYEINPGGTTRYFHLYEGKIPINAVIEAIVVPIDKHQNKAYSKLRLKSHCCQIFQCSKM